MQCEEYWAWNFVSSFFHQTMQTICKNVLNVSFLCLPYTANSERDICGIYSTMDGTTTMSGDREIKLEIYVVIWNPDP